MKGTDMKYLLFIVLLLAVVITAGCVSENKSNLTLSDTPTPTTSIPTTVIIPEITTSIIPSITPNVTTPNVTTIPSITPTKTPTPKPDPTDVSEIKFLHYSNSDFSVDYPSTWIIANSTYFPYYCESVLDTSRNDYHVCFENETKSIGPFYFWENDNYKKPYRIVTFTSSDGKLKFVSFTQDFLETKSGNYMLKPNMDWTRAQFEARYPDLTSSTYITNYKYYQSENVLTSTFDVKLPEGTKYVPSAYSEKALVTVHHVQCFAFITDNENFDKYKGLKERIISSIKTSDKW
jgi:hypothetical protein